MKAAIFKDSNVTIIQFIRFSVVGLSNTIISYLIYSLLVYFGLYYIIASIIAFIIGVLNSFFWNNKFVFKKNDEYARNSVKSLMRSFISYGITGLVLQNILLFIYVDIFRVSKYIAPVFSLTVTVPLNFVLNKFWVFRAQVRME